MRMFYQGSLQSGISAAVQQSKLVTCFVRDDEDESAIWENDFLQEATLVPLLSEKTLMLRLQAGSQEAGFLAAIYPIPKTPTLVIIHNGQLMEYLTAGVSKAVFLQRMKVALNGGREMSTPVATEGISTPVSADESDLAIASTNSRDQMPAEEEQSRTVRELLADRSAHLGSKKKEQDLAEKAERAAKAKARKEALEIAAGDIEYSKKAADMKYALMQKKRQQDARNERARILKRVEADKVERRAKEALRKEKANPAIESSDLESSTTVQPISSNLQRSLKEQESDCALQVRLFDGTTIRSRFNIQNTLRKDVRNWIDGQQADGDIPYTFKQILTPHPNKTITISEEEQSLLSLGLNPSTTLILVPVKDYTSAYEGGATSFVSKGISAGVGLVSYCINMVTGALRSLLGGNTASGLGIEHENHSSPAPAATNVRTLREQGGGPEEHQLYNGNALNFEPRRDDDHEED